MEENLPPYVPVEDGGIQELLSNAAGVLLPEYVTPQRYQSITRYAREWFPNLDARFDCCGKTRQTLLFRKLGVRHPESLLFDNPRLLMEYFERNGSPWGYPLVLKGDLGGGGSTVFPIRKPENLPGCLEKLRSEEPCLLQRWVEHGGKDLRVVVYGDHTVSYFRVGDGRFYNNVCRGGRLDHLGWPELQEKGVQAVRNFCSLSKIDIAGFDLMFPDEGEPVFVEINFHFGRKGLGGFDGHRRHILQAIGEWRNRCLRVPAGPLSPFSQTIEGSSRNGSHLPPCSAVHGT
jgi:ribosomal protein S6--L-glutamate ligase